jgi:uncharacterized membrane protein YccC
MFANPVWPPGPPARLAIRTTVAALLTYAIATGLALPQAFWAVMTTLIVVQGSVGGTLGAGLDRIAGTLGGAALGAAVALLQPVLGMPDSVALVIAIAPLAMLAAHQTRFRVAPLTAAIILLGSPPDVAPLLAATHRVVEILLGSLVGLGVSLLVLPARAHALLATHTAEALRVLADLVQRHLAAAAATTDHVAIERQGDRYRRLLAAAETAAREARRERTSRLTDAPAPEPAVRALRRLRSDVAMLGRATIQPLPEGLAARAAPDLVALATVLRSFMTAAASGLEVGTVPPELGPVDGAIGRFFAAWAVLQPRIEAAAIAGQCPKALLALPFAIETLRRDLGDLAAILAVLAGVPSAAAPSRLREEELR